MHVDGFQLDVPDPLLLIDCVDVRVEVVCPAFDPSKDLFLRVIFCPDPQKLRSAGLQEVLLVEALKIEGSKEADNIARQIQFRPISGTPGLPIRRLF